MVEFDANRIEKEVMAKLFAVGQRYAPVLENYAKKNAPWNDITGNARNGLYGRAELLPNTVRIILGHSVEYGIYLEQRWAFKYAILMPTLLKHYNEIMWKAREIF